MPHRLSLRERESRPSRSTKITTRPRSGEAFAQPDRPQGTSKNAQPVFDRVDPFRQKPRLSLDSNRQFPTASNISFDLPSGDPNFTNVGPGGRVQLANNPIIPEGIPGIPNLEDYFQYRSTHPGMLTSPFGRVEAVRTGDTNIQRFSSFGDPAVDLLRQAFDPGFGASAAFGQQARDAGLRRVAELSDSGVRNPNSLMFRAPKGKFGTPDISTRFQENMIQRILQTFNLSQEDVEDLLEQQAEQPAKDASRAAKRAKSPEKIARDERDAARREATAGRRDERRGRGSGNGNGGNGEGTNGPDIPPPNETPTGLPPLAPPTEQTDAVANAARLLFGAVENNPFITQQGRSALSSGRVPGLNQFQPGFFRNTQPSIQQSYLGLLESIGVPRQDAAFTSNQFRPASIF